MATNVRLQSPQSTEHKRPLPPPRSREFVLSQFEAVHHWAVIDDAESLQMCIPQKRPKLHHGGNDRSSSTEEARARFNKSSMKSSHHIFQHLIDAQPHPVKHRKKRLFVSNGLYARNATADACNYRTMDERNQSEYMLTQRFEGQISDSLASEATATDRRASFKIHEDDQQEARRLARLTHAQTDDERGAETSQVPRVSSNLQDEVQNNYLARKQFEAAAAERSRELRDRARFRRMANTSNNITESTSEQDTSKDMTDTSHTSSHSSGSDAELESDSVETSPFHISSETQSFKDHTESLDVDKMFDVTYHAEGNGAVSCSSMQEPSRSSILTKDKQESISTPNEFGSQNGLNPLSRAAAEQFRTQSRHLTGDVEHMEPDVHTSQGFYQREQKLRMLTSTPFSPNERSGPNNLATTSNLKLLPSLPDSSLTELPDEHEMQNVSKDIVSKELSEQIHLTSNINSAEQDDEVANVLPERVRPKPFPKSPLSEEVSITEPENSNSPSSVTVSFQPECNGAASLSYPPLRSASSAREAAVFPPLKPQKIAPVQPSIADRSQTDSAGASSETYYPKTPPDLTLPKTFHLYSQEHQDVIFECETLKERLRDLEAILPTFEQIARAGALNEFTERERREVRTVVDFTKAVVDDNLSGKRVRRRVNEIRQSMSRRIEKRAPSTEPEYESLLNRLLKKQQRENIAQLIVQVRIDLDRLRVVRNEYTNKWHSNKEKKGRSEADVVATQKEVRKQKRVHFADIVGQPAHSYSDLPAGTEIQLPGNDSLGNPVLSKSERRRKRQYEYQDKQIERLRERLAAFETTNEDGSLGHHNALNSDSNLGIESPDTDGESIISEEDEGAEFFSAPSLPQELDGTLLDLGKGSKESTIANFIEELKEAAIESDNACSQAPHEELALTNHGKQNQRAILNQQRAQLPKCNSGPENKFSYDGSRVSVLPADAITVQQPDLDFDDIDDSSNDEDACCYRYVVKAIYNGVMSYEDDCEYTHGRFQSSSNASSELANLSKELRFWYRQGLEPGEERAIHEHLHDEGEMEGRYIEFGHEKQASCRAWIEKEEYNPSVEAYKNAKIKRACHAKPIYTVRWEKTITTVTPISDGVTNSLENSGIEVSTTAAAAAAATTTTATTANTTQPTPSSEPNTNDDDLFGPDPSPPDATNLSSALPTSTTTQIDYKALRFFSSISWANKHAKDIFIIWYMDHHRGPTHHKTIRREEEALDKLLESYGDRVKWEREETHTRYTTDNDEQNTPTSHETLRIWVEMVTVTGPAN